MRQLIFILLFISCCTSNTSNTEAPQKPEDFNAFFAKFKNSKKLQSERIVKPLISYQLEIGDNNNTYTPVQITEKDLLFEQKDWIEPIVLSIEPSDENLEEMLVILKGIETGLFIEYHFRLQNNKWYLFKVMDEST